MSKIRRWKIYNRRVLVETFQLRFVGVAIVHFLLVVAIFLAAMFAPIIIDLRSDAISAPHVQAAAREFLFLHTRLWLPLFGAFTLVILHNILVSHRVAGPLLRFRRYLRGVGEGDLSHPIQFRKGDYLGQEAHAASNMVEALRMRIERMEDRIEQTDAAWMRLRDNLRDGKIEERGKQIAALDESLAACRAGLRAFKLKTGNEPGVATANQPDSSDKLKSSRSESCAVLRS